MGARSAAAASTATGFGNRMHSCCQAPWPVHAEGLRRHVPGGAEFERAQARRAAGVRTDYNLPGSRRPRRGRTDGDAHARCALEEGGGSSAAARWRECIGRQAEAGGTTQQDLRGGMRTRPGLAAVCIQLAGPGGWCKRFDTAAADGASHTLPRTWHSWWRRYVQRFRPRLVCAVATRLAVSGAGAVYSSNAVGNPGQTIARRGQTGRQDHRQIGRGQRPGRQSTGPAPDNRRPDARGARRRLGAALAGGRARSASSRARTRVLACALKRTPA